MTYFIGADPASINVGLAALHEAGDLHDAARLTGHDTTCLLHAPGTDPGRRYVWLRREIIRWAAPYADLGVTCAVIEDPATHTAGSTLRASLGVVHEALCSVLPDTPVHVLKSTRVKALALGRGSGKKADLMAGARLLGYEGDSQDIADAVCAADAARVLARMNTKAVA